ncbi:site-specific integrase [Shewanella avicenniae]|uniref:Site-specific integrase n=1 Tax=Shewanella avicenniae TaxID=2814294 RepID=A0ABX7QKX2_9GAMM|nr:site-specific integrase [Shewanella avicenniae]QSX32102.1 site-specific integrase [Shewanella avicenniae]
MNEVERYIEAATRDNTRRSYQAAIEHFEVDWGGMLPTTSEQVARYLAHYADTLSHSTLRLRLAAIGQWHVSQGFVDPTKSPLVRKVFKGIREVHPARTKQAKPLAIDELAQICDYLEREQHSDDQLTALGATRDKALLLMGFWRGFRGDELCRMMIDHIEFVPTQGMIIYLPRSKSDRTNQGREYRTPALQRLCPVQAYQEWLAISGLSTGPVFRSINRWGQISHESLRPSSIVPLMRKLMAKAGLSNADLYSSHSLRRGFASWATQHQWSLKQLMEYVGWCDAQSALRYIEVSAPFTAEQLQSSGSHVAISPPMINLDIQLNLTRFHDKAPCEKTVRLKLERFVLKAFGGLTIIDDQHYQLQLPVATVEAELDELADELLDRLHSFASDHQCMLEVVISHSQSGQQWD